MMKSKRRSSIGYDKLKDYEKFVQRPSTSVGMKRALNYSMSYANDESNPRTVLINTNLDEENDK